MRIRKQRPFSSLLLAGIAALGITLAGCGSSSSDATQDTSNATAASASLQDKCNGEEVTFQLTYFVNPQHVGFVEADKHGYWADEGLSVTMKPGSPTIKPLQDVASGAADIGQVRWPETLEAGLKGAPVTYVAELYRGPQYRYGVLKSSGIESIEDFEGKSVATLSPGDPVTELRGMLDTAGLTVEDVELVPSTPNVGLLLEGKVDLFPVNAFYFLPQLEAAGNLDRIRFFDPKEFGVREADHGIIVNNQFLEENRHAVACFVRGAMRGWLEAKKNPDRAAKDVFQAMNRTMPLDQVAIGNRATIQQLVIPEGFPPEDVLKIDEMDLRAAAELLESTGAIPRGTEIDKYYDAELWHEASGQ